MCGMKRRNTSSKTANDPKSKINAALRVWGCRCGTNESYETESSMNEIQLRVKEKFIAEGAEGCGCGGKGKPKPKPKPTIKRPKNQITEEVVNKSNQPMTKREIKKRDKIKKGLGDVAIVKKGDTKENAKYRLATYITLLKKKKKKG